MRLDDINEGVAGPEKCWPGHRKVGTKPGTGKNAGKRVNDCEKIKEDVDVVDQGEYDREGDMAIGQLNTIEDAAAELRSILDAEDNLPEWVQSKITKAVDYIDTARDYMKSKEGVTEVSKSTLDRYVSKAVDAHGHADFAARQSKNDPTLRSYHVDQKKTAEKRRQGISRALDRMSKEGVAEGLGKTIKRGMAGWGAFDKDKPADVVKRVKDQDTDTLKGLSNRGSTGKGSHAELQQKAIGRELKKRGEQGVAEGSGTTPKITFAQQTPGSWTRIDILVDGDVKFQAVKTMGPGHWTIHDQDGEVIGDGGNKTELKASVLNYLSKQGVAEGDKKPHPKTWHDVDPKLGKQVDKMSQAEKVKKGLAHPDTLKKKGVAEGFKEQYIYLSPMRGLSEPKFVAKVKGRVTNDILNKLAAKYKVSIEDFEWGDAKWAQQHQGVAEGLPQTLRKVVPGYAKREIDKKMDAGKFGKTDADKDANFQRYKKIQDKIKEQGVAEAIRNTDDPQDDMVEDYLDYLESIGMLDKSREEEKAQILADLEAGYLHSSEIEYALSGTKWDPFSQRDVAEERNSALSRAVREAGWGRRYSSYHDELSSRERAEQDYMDQSKRDFKRSEHEAEWEREKQFAQQQMDKDRGPWYIRIDGKVYKQKGAAKSFDWKRGANNYALAMIKNNPSLQGRVLLTKSAEDK